jgi:enoyl-CoA hydratase/carnithine racemase
MSFFGRKYNGPDALIAGMVDKTVPKDEVLGEAMKLAQELASKDGYTFGQIRQELYRTAIDTFNEAPCSFELDGFRNLLAARAKRSKL